MDELEALKIIDAAFGGMEKGAQSRTLQWLNGKYSVGVQSALPAPQARSGNDSTQPITMTAKAVATVFKVDSGTELVFSTAAYLAVVMELDTFSRQTLLETMKSAVGFYKPTYRSNLSGYIDSLCRKGALIEVSSHTYAVKAGSLAEMKKVLVEG